MLLASWIGVVVFSAFTATDQASAENIPQDVSARLE